MTLQALEIELDMRGIHWLRIHVTAARYDVLAHRRGRVGERTIFEAEGDTLVEAMDRLLSLAPKNT